jgi:WD40 repeat protein
MKKTQFCSALVVVLLSLAAVNLVQSEPAKDKPKIRLVQAGKLKLDDLVVADAAVIDENTVVIVGRKGDIEDLPLVVDQKDPNGAIIDLVKKSARPFTNGHKARINSVSVGRGRVATVSTKRDPVLRIWDLKAGKVDKQIELNKLFENIREKYRDGEPLDYAVAWFHKSDRLAIAASEYVILLKPARPDDMSLLQTPWLTRRDKRENVILPDWWIRGPIAISPDDTCVACPVGWSTAVFWNKLGKPTDVPLIPKGAKDSEQWHVDGLTFSPAGKLFAWRSVGADKVPAERRMIVQIDLIDVPEGKYVPLRMKQNVNPYSCAIDPTGIWLATVGMSPPDKPRRDGKTSVSELRVYNLSSKELAYREQVEGLPLMGVSFTPGGKRIVSTTSDGVIRWWDVAAR